VKQLLHRLRNAFPYWNQFGFKGRAIARTLFPQNPPAQGELGTLRLPGLPRPLRFRYRTMDNSVFSQVFIDRVYDAKLPFAPKTIIDAGANVGLSALFLHRKYPDATIVALEAEESNFKLLQENVQGYPSIYPLQAALWYQDGWLSLQDESATHSSFRFSADAGGKMRVPALCPHSIMQKYHWAQIDLFKINIEGGEKELFGHEPSDWIPQVQVFMMDLHDRLLPGCSETVMQALVPTGFTHTPIGELHLFTRARL
jgi:FkbM family methyltransferase